MSDRILNHKNSLRPVFRKPILEDRELLRSYLEKEHFYGCDFTFANILLWSDYYKVDFAILEDALVFRSGEEGSGGQAFSFPIGTQKLETVLDRLRDICREDGRTLLLYHITQTMQEKIEAVYPGKFLFSPNRDSFDYIYNTSDLTGLAGKKFHGKRNHIHKFMENDWTYESLDKENVEDCLEMNRKWCRQNECGKDESKQAEYGVVQNALRQFEELGLSGGLLRVNGQVVAFSLGERVNEDLFVVHIEKAFSDIQGAYPMINREFAAHEAVDCKYVNREEDMGIEGLRKAKLSYRPVFLLEKSDAIYQG